MRCGVGGSISADVSWRAAYYKTPSPPCDRTLVELPQHYVRRSERTYGYESPSVPYSAELEIAPNGFVRSYPDLWMLESD